jgi:mono/diheme cytochrome c family protein
MRRVIRIVSVAGAIALATVATAGLGGALSTAAPSASSTKPLDGKQIFRFDTFADEQLWTDVLRMHEVLPSVSPATALAVGLKVDSDALPPPVIAAIRAGELKVNDPRVTLRLLEMNAVVGVIGKVSGDRLMSVGITCAFCHSTVDNSLALGIGSRLDGWPNRDLNVGLIVGLSPSRVIDPFRQEFAQWGPGKYDARHHIFDGANLMLLHSLETIPVVIPPAFGLQGVGFETYTGDGPISYWNSYVGVTQMGGHGSFSDDRIGVNVAQKPDRVTPKLPALLAYQLSLVAPPPPAGSFNQAAATRGQVLFNGVARCGTCHIPPTYTDVLSGPDPKVPFLHAASEIGADVEYAARSATEMYRTTPLRGAWQHSPYFHDGRAADFLAVVNYYNSFFSLGLTDAQKMDLVEFLKSL